MSRRLNQIRSGVREMRSRILRRYSLEFTLAMILLFFIIFHLLIFYVIFPAKEFNFTLDYFSSIPLKQQAHKNTKTIQDRFRYSRKDLENQTCPELVGYIRNTWLRPIPKTPAAFPPKEKFDLDMKSYQIFSVQNLMPTYKTNGFYVEYAAFDGFTESPTVNLEAKHNWTGLLIEPDPTYFEILTKINRNAWTINSCVSIHPKMAMSKMLRFNPGDRSIMSEFATTSEEQSQPPVVVNAQCFPLTSILLAANVTTVDFLHLDAPGASLHILKTVLWDVVNVRAISIIEDNLHMDKAESFQLLLAKHGYVSKGIIPGNLTTAYIFWHEKNYT